MFECASWWQLVVGGFVGLEIIVLRVVKCLFVRLSNLLGGLFIVLPGGWILSLLAHCLCFLDCFLYSLLPLG
jgi:hypothetical protein